MPDKKPWGSNQMSALLARIRMPNPNAAMSTVMSLDYASRDGNANEELTVATALADMHPHENKDALVKAILSQYDKMDRVFQPEYYGTTEFVEDESDNDSDEDILGGGEDYFKDDETDGTPPPPKSMKDVKSEMTRTIDRMAAMMSSRGGSDAAKKFGGVFARSLIDSGFGGNKSFDEFMNPMMSAATLKFEALEAANRSVSDSEDNDAETASATDSYYDNELQNQMDALPRVLWDDPDFKKVATALPQAFKKKDSDMMERIIAYAIANGQRVSNEKGLGLTVTRELILKDFLPPEQRREFANWDQDADESVSDSDSEFTQDSADPNFGRDNQDSGDMGADLANQHDLIPPEELNALRLEGYKQLFVETDSNGMDGAKSFLASFAQSLSKRGLDKKAVQNTVKPMLVEASKRAAKRNTPAEPVPEDLIKLIADDKGFQEEAKRAVKALEAQIPSEMEECLDGAVSEAMLVRDMRGFKTKITQQMVTDIIFDKKQQAEMKTWIRSPIDDGGDEQSDDGVIVTLADLKKIDYSQVASVYSFSIDDIPDLEDLAKMIVKKGVDSPAAIKSAKDVIAKSKKNKNKPKAKSGPYLAHAMLDAARRSLAKKKVTKPMKASEIEEA